MDHYRTLGLSRNATKEEIKDAFRRSALKFHPDRHSHSSKEAREGASAKFRRASEAYEVLIDDRKRADYDLRTRVHRPSSSSSYTSSSSSSSYSSKSSSSSGNSYYGAPRRPRDGFEFSFSFRHRVGRALFMNILLASALFVGASLMERAVEGIWKRNNSGKSFEDLMESIEKDKVQKENRGDL